MKKLYFYLMVLLFSSCIDDDIDMQRLENGSGISIYIVKEGQLQIHSNPSKSEIDKLELERDPWVIPSEIEFYDWSAHTFYLKKPKDKNEYSGNHFVVASGNERLFAGVFFPPYLSSLPQIPSIVPMDGFQPADIIQFGMFGHSYSGQSDKLANLREALIHSGLYHEGLSVEITHVVKKSATAVNYSFKVTNHDKTILYVLDPDKMGNCRFHYYTNGISFQKGNSYYYADSKDNCPSEKINDAWYYKLTPSESITRTVELQGFQSLPSGTVKCFFSFPGSILKTGEWKKSDGRVWLGNFYAEKELELR